MSPDNDPTARRDRETPEPTQNLPVLTDERGAAETVGYALLIGIVILTVGMIGLGGGLESLANLQEQPKISNAQQSMAQFAAETSAVGHGSATSRQVQIAPRSRAVRRANPDAGQLRIIVNKTGEPEKTVFNVSLGSVTYEVGDEEIAYQGGGIWQTAGNTSVMISEPNIYYRSGGGSAETLTLSLITIEKGPDRIGEQVTISKSNSSGDSYTVGGDAEALLEAEVRIEIESEYNDAWANYFRTRTPARVNQSGGVVTAKVREQQTPVTAQQGLTTIGTGTTTLDNGERILIDAYSSDGNPVGNDGDLYFAGDLSVGENIDELTALGELKARNIDIAPAAEDSVNTIGRTEHSDSTTGLSTEAEIEQINQEFSNLNLKNNAKNTGGIKADGTTKVISEDTYADGDITATNGGQVTITTDVNESNINAEATGDIIIKENSDLIIDTTAGDVVLRATELKVFGGSEVRVIGSNNVEILTEYMTVKGGSRYEVGSLAKSSNYISDDLRVESGSTLESNNGEADRLWLYAQDNIAVDSNDEVVITGVIYAPDASTDIQSDMTLNGALVTGSLQISNSYLQLNYDTELRNTQPFSQRKEVLASVVYLHASEEKVEIE